MTDGLEHEELDPLLCGVDARKTYLTAIDGGFWPGPRGRDDLPHPL
eukprot:CAMPEP_0201870338 /NCGR_PEP_ID=MMETSP0902-20130614/3471_1 /ASSEMBLY_ACC=CAM_ASM_000551 /TAXON_ID=420261 /ORGANISM="Thalassiosira antarctica, Strain CCMP982" /LENGTH=45 /DNA_ID= /DNA_START= /DNA_END= /DNA_ORIENTATION=